MSSMSNLTAHLLSRQYVYSLTYRQLQQISKRLNIPSNIKKTHLQEAIYHTYHGNHERVASIISQVQRERRAAKKWEMASKVGKNKYNSRYNGLPLKALEGLKLGREMSVRLVTPMESRLIRKRATQVDSRLPQANKTATAKAKTSPVPCNRILRNQRYPIYSKLSQRNKKRLRAEHGENTVSSSVDDRDRQSVRNQQLNHYTYEDTQSSPCNYIEFFPEHCEDEPLDFSIKKHTDLNNNTYSQTYQQSVIMYSEYSHTFPSNDENSVAVYSEYQNQYSHYEYTEVHNPPKAVEVPQASRFQSDHTYSTQAVQYRNHPDSTVNDDNIKTTFQYLRNVEPYVTQSYYVPAVQENERAGHNYDTYEKEREIYEAESAREVCDKQQQTDLLVPNTEMEQNFVNNDERGRMYEVAQQKKASEKNLAEYDGKKQDHAITTEYRVQTIKSAEYNTAQAYHEQYVRAGQNYANTAPVHSNAELAVQLYTNENELQNGQINEYEGSGYDYANSEILQDGRTSGGTSEYENTGYESYETSNELDRSVREPLPPISEAFPKYCRATQTFSPLYVCVNNEETQAPSENNIFLKTMNETSESENLDGVTTVLVQMEEPTPESEDIADIDVAMRAVNTTRCEVGVTVSSSLWQDVLALITQQDDVTNYVESIQCVCCDWNGDSHQLDPHIREAHADQIISYMARVECTHRVSLGALLRDKRHNVLMQWQGRLVMLLVAYEDPEWLMASVALLSPHGESPFVQSTITVYDKVTGAPFKWSGPVLKSNIVFYSNPTAYLKMQLSKLGLIHNSADVVIWNRQLQAQDCKTICGASVFDDVMIDFHVELCG